MSGTTTSDSESLSPSTTVEVDTPQVADKTAEEEEAEAAATAAAAVAEEKDRLVSGLRQASLAGNLPLTYHTLTTLLLGYGKIPTTAFNSATNNNVLLSSTTTTITTTTTTTTDTTTSTESNNLLLNEEEEGEGVELEDSEEEEEEAEIEGSEGEGEQPSSSYFNNDSTSSTTQVNTVRDPMDLQPEVEPVVGKGKADAEVEKENENENENEKEKEKGEEVDDTTQEGEEEFGSETEFQRLRQKLLYESPYELVESLPVLRQYHRILFGYKRANEVTVYGRDFTHLHQRGIRLCGRTLLELKPDLIAKGVGEKVVTLLRMFLHFEQKVRSAKRPPFLLKPTTTAAAAGPGSQSIVIADLFCGSGNSLFGMSQAFQKKEWKEIYSLGFELNSKIYSQTKANLSMLEEAEEGGLRLEVRNLDYVHGLQAIKKEGRMTQGGNSNTILLCIIDPPWGAALEPSKTTGLSAMDLMKTEPPIPEILMAIIECFPEEVLDHRVMVVIQLFYKRRLLETFFQVLKFFSSCQHGYAPSSPTQGFIFGVL